MSTSQAGSSEPPPGATRPPPMEGHGGAQGPALLPDAALGNWKHVERLRPPELALSVSPATDLPHLRLRVWDLRAAGASGSKAASPPVLEISSRNKAHFKRYFLTAQFRLFYIVRW